MKIGMGVVNRGVIDGANLFVLLCQSADKFNLSDAQAFAIAEYLGGKKLIASARRAVLEVR